MKQISSYALPVFSFAQPPRVLMVEARFYTDIADHLVAGALRVLEASGAVVERITVPGALEIPAAVAMAAASGRFDAYVALGCVIRGETFHFDVVCNESARGLTLLSIEHRLALGNGILTVETMAQAMERARPDQMDKGGGAAAAALTMLDLKAGFGLYPPYE
jgi:6,7-dimethyl-8-ribityllumazine synthase